MMARADSPNDVFVVPVVSRADYPAFCRLSVDCPSPAPDFDAWLKRIRDGLQQMRALGKGAVEVTVDPQQMAAWCLVNKREVNTHGRAAYAAIVYADLHRKPDSHGPPQ